jgi:hypothetical protein
MSAATALARGRAAALALMVDTCVIKRVTGETTDPFSGTITPTAVTLYAGMCRVQHREAQGREETPGQAFLVMLLLELQLPMTVTGLQVDDQVTITASAHDPDLAGRTFYIRDLMHKTHATARRVSIQERTS